MQFSGTVIHGKKLGRTIGYPTANIELAPGVVEDGVYVLEVESDGVRHRGMGTYRANIALFEANIFDFSGDLYGKSITIIIREKIRENKKFNSLDELQSQIGKDAEQAKTFAF